MPEATVTISNSSLGLRRKAGTTDDGAFDIPALPPAAGFRLSIVCKGYADWDSEPFETAVGQSRIFRIQMQKEGFARNADVGILKRSGVDRSVGRVVRARSE